ncbi:MAG TPA: putative hydro-lyase [Gemmatimonadaceae bacterium]
MSDVRGFESPAALRLAARTGALTGHTAGLAPGFVQGNLVVLPSRLARDFLKFCHVNPKPCPLLALTEPGDTSVAVLGEGIDLRTDLPSYRVWRDGKLVEERTDVVDLWRDDFIGFVLGCSFSFEEALMDAGLRLKHVEQGTNVPMFRTNIQCRPYGPFAGPLVVSMRPFAPAQAIRAIEVTTHFPALHGAPIHVGDPRQIGIEDLSRPDYGDPLAVEDNEIAVFWACGVTPQAVIASAGISFAITHSPGCMLVTDIPNARLRAHTGDGHELGVLRPLGAGRSA